MSREIMRFTAREWFVLEKALERLADGDVLEDDEGRPVDLCADAERIAARVRTYRGRHRSTMIDDGDAM